MRTIRVALLAMQPRLRDILVDAVDREEDMEVIHRACGLDAALVAAKPDAMVLETRDPLDLEMPQALLSALPRSRVLMVADTGDKAAVYELRPTCKVLSNVSMSQVIDAIRLGVDAPIVDAPSDGGRARTGDDNS